MSVDIRPGKINDVHKYHIIAALYPFCELQRIHNVNGSTVAGHLEARSLYIGIIQNQVPAKVEIGTLSGPVIAGQAFIYPIS